MLDSVTKRRIDTARDILVGKVPDPKSQVSQITIALIYKFMDDMDTEAEEMGGKRRFFTGDLEKYAWSKLMSPATSGHQRLYLYGEAIDKFQTSTNLPQLFRDIFKNELLPYRDPETLNLFLKTINEFTYDHSERLGDAFEYLLSVLGSQGDAGQFRTPRHIIDFIVECVDPQKNDRILDPACGTAGFLISAYKYILRQNAKDGKDGAALTPDERARLLDNMVGYDISPDMVRLSRANMYLHGFPTPKIAEYDTLTSEDKWGEYYDVIVANPPFMTPKGGIQPHRKFSVQANRSEVLFVDYIAEHLLQNGRAGVIVPEGIIFNGGKAYGALRKMLVNDYLFAVVSLPAGVFNPYAGVKTSILLMDKQLARHSDSILFVRVDNDGFDLGAQRKPVAENTLPVATRTVVEFKSSVIQGRLFGSSDLALVVKKNKISENSDYNLTAERYRNPSILNHTWLTQTVGDTCTLMTGGTPSSTVSEYYDNGDIKWLVSGDIHMGVIFDCEKRITQLGLDNSNARWLPENSVLMALNGQGKTRGTVALLRCKATCNQSIVSISPNDKTILLPEFLYYQLRARYQEIRDLTGDNQRSGLNMPIIRDIKIPLPPLPVQQEIVAEIEVYQKIVDGARQVVENYESRIKIDPNWPVKELSTLTTSMKSGFAAGNFSRNPEDIIHLRPMNVTEEGLLSLSDLKYLPKESLVTRGDYYVSINDILFNNTNSKELVGKTCLINTDIKAVYSNHMTRIQTNDKVLPHFLASLLHQMWRNGIFLSMCNKWVGQAGVNLDMLSSLKVPVPPLSTQQQIVTQLEKEGSLVNSNNELIGIFEQKIKDKISEVWQT